MHGLSLKNRYSESYNIYMKMIIYYIFKLFNITQLASTMAEKIPKFQTKKVVKYIEFFMLSREILFVRCKQAIKRNKYVIFIIKKRKTN